MISESRRLLNDSRTSLTTPAPHAGVPLEVGLQFAKDSGRIFLEPLHRLHHVGERHRWRLVALLHTAPALQDGTVIALVKGDLEGLPELIALLRVHDVVRVQPALLPAGLAAVPFTSIATLALALHRSAALGQHVLEEHEVDHDGGREEAELEAEARKDLADGDQGICDHGGRE